MPRLILIRHACTMTGGPQCMSGWTDTPLVAQGYEQLAALASSIQAEPPFDALFCSPLQRARETARAILERSAAGVVYVEHLKEIHCGEVDGAPITEVQRRYPQLWAENLAQRDPDFRWPGGESYREFRQRCLDAIRHIADRHVQRVAVVTHAGVINQILGSLAGLSPAQWEPFRPDNASITEVEWYGASGTVIAFNRRAGARTANGVRADQ